MDSKTIRQKYIQFFKEKGHTEIAPAKLVPENDPTTLFTSSGMQPMVPYLLGEFHPEGNRIVDSQKVFRSVDIDEVGIDTRHLTLFEMLGNWSLGDYWKEEQLNWFFEFLTQVVGLDPQKLYVTAFEGNEQIPKDEETLAIWQKIFAEKGIDAKVGERILFYGASKNWWSRSGEPENMPTGEPGGPDSEMFYLFDQIEHDPSFGINCHPNCDCGRFIEIGNSVFMQYQKQPDGGFKELPSRNVDFGGGLERILMAANNQPDIFRNDLHWPIIEKVCQQLEVSYDQNELIKTSLRIISDHIKAATFLIKDGVLPGNKLQGYILRRLLRRAAVKLHLIKSNSLNVLPQLIDQVMDIYHSTEYFNVEDLNLIKGVIVDEMNKFSKTLDKGLREIQKIDQIDAKKAFDLYQSFGFPYEVTEELFSQKGQQINREQFKKEFEKHRELSRSASAGMFKGGLADQSEVTTKYHTTTHLLHQALRDVLGPQVFQKGSNITSERLRFDFSFERKMTEEEVKKVEEIINQRIKQDLKVDRLVVLVEQARTMNAIGLFDDKYAKEVSIYGVGKGLQLDVNAKDQRDRGSYYSLEFCGGPHVGSTGVIGGIKIVKEEAISAGIRRIRAVIVG